MNDCKEFFSRFVALREDLFKAIAHAIEHDGHHKHYEGKLSLIYPHCFEDEYTITLDCYVIGPSRHYHWTGKDFHEALDKAEKDIRKWIDEEYELYSV